MRRLLGHPRDCPAAAVGTLSANTCGSSGRIICPIATAGRKIQGRGNASLRCGADQALPERTRHALAQDLAPDIEQAVIFHSRRTGRFAGTAGQAAVEVRLRLLGDLLAFEHLLDQVDAATRTIELVTEQPVDRAGRGTETAMHAGAQDGIGLTAFRRTPDEIGEIGLHDLDVQNSGTCDRG